MIPQSIDTDIVQILTTEQAWHYMILPVNLEKDTLNLLIAQDKLDATTSEELEVLLGYEVNLKTISRDLLQKEMARYYRKPRDQRKKVSSLNFSKEKDQSFLINLIKEAKQLGSSDIHIEHYEERCRIRIRIDGKLIEKYILDKTNYPSLINKIKIQSNLDIAEKRLPQDGRIFLKLENNSTLDLRVSVLPTLHGEKVVMRLLSSDANDIELTSLGFLKNDLDNYIEGVKKPNGIILISGPTGSGKTTTLYSTLQLLNKPDINIVTIEDPIEYTLEGINQVQLKENIGLDFPSAMRTFLRQDPDVIMVGEIRDKATASMAIRASLTGHLVLSTIHTNSAWGIIARLIDMGIPAYLLADTLNTAVAQRLVRLLCPSCKKEIPFSEAHLPRLYKAPFKLTSHFIAQGCDKCFYTGYKGRKAVYEVIPIDAELAIKIKSEDLQISNLLKDRNIKGLAHNAFSILATGETSIEEIYPILASTDK